MSMKQPWEAKDFQELNAILDATLTNGETPIEHVTRLLAMRNRQRQGDHRRNRDRRSDLQYMKAHPELQKKARA